VEALIAISSLGLLIMLVELMGLRKLVAPVAVLGLLVTLILNFMHWNEHVVLDPMYNDMYVVNKATMTFTGVILFIALFLVILGGDFYKDEKKYWSDYLAIYIFAVSGAVLMIGAHHLLMTFIGIEILSVSLYVLAGSNRRKLESNEAGMKYFLMGAFASGILLFGMVLLYGATGTLHYTKLSSAMFVDEAIGNNLPFLHCGIIMVLIGFLFKISAAPFHFWSPDVYQGSPSIVTAFMATIAKIAAVASLYIVLNQVFISQDHLYNIVLILVCIATISIGNVLAIVQTNFKRMMAYSGISHAGFMLLGIISIDFNNWHLLAYYTVGYGVANLVGFGVAIPIFRSMNSENVAAFNGLFFKKPWMAICMTIALLSMASIPPLAGFWGKYYVLSAALSKGLLLMVIIAIINTVLSVYFYFRIFVAMYGRKAHGPNIDSSKGYAFVVILLAIILLAISLSPDMIASFI
jgi:NADH-quinone oxidoreductase subunit N